MDTKAGHGPLSAYFIVVGIQTHPEMESNLGAGATFQMGRKSSDLGEGSEVGVATVGENYAPVIVSYWIERPSCK